MNSSFALSGVAVIAALGFEARSAAPLQRQGWKVRIGGMGPECARRAAQELVAAGARSLLVWGVAGGLVGSLRVGTVFLPDTVINAADDYRFAVSPRIHAVLSHQLAALETPCITRGALLTVREPLYTPHDKQQAGRRSGALMVDMEAAAVAEVATAAGIEFAVLRVLLDAVDVVLPPVVVEAVERRHPHLGVFLGLWKRPQELPAVLRLGSSFRYACQSLQSVARKLAATGP